MTDDNKVWMAEFIKNVGFPIALCCLLMYGGYQIVVPVFAAQVDTIKKVGDAQNVMVKTLETLAKEVNDVHTTQQVHKDILAELTTSQKDALTTLKEIEKNTSPK